MTDYVDLMCEIASQKLLSGYNERLVSYLGRPYSHTERYGRKKGLERESDDVIVGESRRTETIYSTNRYV